MGDAITANMFMLGAAWQRGWCRCRPRRSTARSSSTAWRSTSNRRAFLWGRRAAHDPAAIERIAAGPGGAAAQVVRFDARRPAPLAELVSQRIAFLRQYQDDAYARRYASTIERVQLAEARTGRGDALSKAVGKGLFKLMAHKDEWEVARLYASPAFREELERTFEGPYRLRFTWPAGRSAGAIRRPGGWSSARSARG
jgi:indolepyruvate ferredoxin oxidoreductase